MGEESHDWKNTETLVAYASSAQEAQRASPEMASTWEKRGDSAFVHSFAFILMCDTCPLGLVRKFKL